MNSSIGIIGGADGPTAVFVTSSPSWINLFGLIIVILLLVPNAIYAIKHRNAENKCTNRLMNILEQIGRYGCMLLMIFNIGIGEFAYSSVAALLIYLFGNVLLLTGYHICWALYFKKATSSLALTMAILPTAIFLLSGLTLRHYLLIAASIIFGIAHIYVTRANSR